MQQQRKVDDAGAVRLPGGAPHQVQQGAQAAGPLHRAVQQDRVVRLEQRAEIPLHHALQLGQHRRREAAADQLRGQMPRLLKHAAPRPQQQYAAGVDQQRSISPPERAAAAGHHQDAAGLLVLLQAVLALGHPQLERQRLCIQFIAFRSHWHHGSPAFFVFSSVSRPPRAGKPKPQGGFVL